MELNPDIRWKQRFQNFDRAFVLLRQALENGPDALNPLEKEGAVQRFEYCFELAWKTAKDYLEESGFIFPTVTPRQVLKDAFAAKLIVDGQVWIDMLNHRNLLWHTYSVLSFEQAVEAIHARYFAGIDQLHELLQEKIADHDHPPPLTARELEMVRTVFRRHPEVVSAILFGSRAKGTHTDRSDVDFALDGEVAPLQAESIAAELDELPLPYRFEVQTLLDVRHQPLREHIRRVGIRIYPEHLA